MVRQDVHHHLCPVGAGRVLPLSITRPVAGCWYRARRRSPTSTNSGGKKICATTGSDSLSTNQGKAGRARSRSRSPTGRTAWVMLQQGEVDGVSTDDTIPGRHGRPGREHQDRRPDHRTPSRTALAFPKSSNDFVSFVNGVLAQIRAKRKLDEVVPDVAGYPTGCHRPGANRSRCIRTDREALDDRRPSCRARRPTRAPARCPRPGCGGRLIGGVCDQCGHNVTAPPQWAGPRSRCPPNPPPIPSPFPHSLFPAQPPIAAVPPRNQPSSQPFPAQRPVRPVPVGARPPVSGGRAGAFGPFPRTGAGRSAPRCPCPAPTSSIPPPVHVAGQHAAPTNLLARPATWQTAGDRTGSGAVGRRAVGQRTQRNVCPAGNRAAAIPRST